MHDPDVVAFTIPRPWPTRTGFSATGSHGDGIRWQIRHHHYCGAWCKNDPPHRTGAFPWWKPGSYRRFWRLAGRDYYWPPLITIWHREPGGADSLSVCRRRVRQPDGTWRFKGHWQLHVWHWRLQIHPYQWARRRLLTRCTWCGGRDRKGDPVNIASSWYPPKAPWWRGENDLFHNDCLSVERAARTCMCDDPIIGPGHSYGTCARCGRFRPYNYTPDEADRLLAGVPRGSRIPPSLKPRLDTLWAARREARAGS